MLRTPARPGRRRSRWRTGRAPRSTPGSSRPAVSPWPLRRESPARGPSRWSTGTTAIRRSTSAWWSSRVTAARSRGSGASWTASDEPGVRGASIGIGRHGAWYSGDRASRSGDEVPAPLIMLVFSFQSLSSVLRPRARRARERRYWLRATQSLADSTATTAMAQSARACRTAASVWSMEQSKARRRWAL